MNFELSEQQEMLQAATAEFARDVIAPVASECDAKGEFPLASIQQMGELGLMGIEVPEEYGGAGMDAISYVLAMIEISAASAAHGTIMSVNNTLFCNAILQHGTEEQKQTFLKPVAMGEQVGAYALTEPHCGSDASAMRCRAEKTPDGSYKINGKKAWITSGTVASSLILFAVTDPDAGSRGISAFLIDTGKAGFSTGKTEPKLGIKASATCEIEFEDYLCPADCLLGQEGAGFKIAMSILDAGRIGIAAQAVGIARAAYDASLLYVRERQAFGQAIGGFQMIQSKIADMKTRLEAARLLTLQAAWKKQLAAEGSSERFTTEASMAKLYASEAAMFIAHQAVQIHGGMGYSAELPVERYFRDAKITEIYEGTSEIQRLVISRNETGLR